VLWVGLTGGIGAGKSAVARALTGHGAALVDADRVAREVVEQGTSGLAAVVEAFGAAVLRADGTLDREALGRRVFGDDDARRRLNAVLHPLIGARTMELAARAQDGGAPVLVHDVPLLVENGLAAGYHLVVVVEAPVEDRLHRLTAMRGMSEGDAQARMAAQADDAARREVADVVLSNHAGLAALHAQVDVLWRERLAPYAANVERRSSPERGDVALVAADPDWARQGSRLVERLRFVCGDRAVRVEHVGSTAVSGRAAEDVLDLQVEVGSRADAETLAAPLADGGFPRCDVVGGDPLHRGADPGRAVDVHVREAGSTSARAATARRDELLQRALASEDSEV
jgi:dephospho-CoA kinase